MKTFRGRVAAVTGAGSGVGRALARELAARGAHLALADIDESGLAETVMLGQGAGTKITSQRLDVADRDAVYTWADQVVADHGRVNLIVNNAGVGLAATALAAGGQDHLVIVVAAGLGAHRVQQVLIADEAAGLAADRLEVPHGQVHAVLGRRADVVVRAGRHGELSHPGPEDKLHGGQPCLARVDQGQHHHLALLLLPPGEEIVDRLQVQLLVDGQQVHVQDQ